MKKKRLSVDIDDLHGMYHPIQVANYLLDKGQKENIDISCIKLKALIYFTHGWFLAMTGFPLVNEPIFAERYGPEIESLYKIFVPTYGPVSPIKEGVKCIDSKIREIDKPIIDSIWDTYKKMSGVELSNMSHLENSPWDISRKHNLKIISNNLIKSYYSQLLSTHKEQEGEITVQDASFGYR